MDWSIVGFKPLSPLSLKPFTSLPMGLHGPGTGASTLSYPTPSTIAGALAAALVNAAGDRGIVGECSNSGSAFGDVECVLKRILGGGFRIRTGLAIAGKGSRRRVYAYVNTGRLLPLESLARKLASSHIEQGYPEKLPGVILQCIRGQDSDGLDVTSYDTVGIAVSRKSKSVREGMLYNLRRAVYPVDSYITTEVATGREVGMLNGMVVKLGGEGGLARIDLLDLEEPVNRLHGDGRKWLLVTTSISLLDASPFTDRGEQQEESSIVPSSGGLLGEKTAMMIARELLAGYGDSCSLGNASIVYMVKGEMQLETVFPGWPARGNTPRRPHIAVPAGTILYLEASRDCIEGIVEEGLGLYSRLGWGSVIAVGLG